MRKILFVALVAQAAVAGSLLAKGDALLSGNQENQIIVKNRVLAKVNGKAITVIDIMKKLDVFFYKQFPQYIHVPQAKYQFYKANWKAVLGEMIDKELILADAEENKIPVSSGDVRQEMETLFGPNIHATLDKMNLTFEEAWKMIHNDIKIRRMIYARVNNKALAEVTPQLVKNEYEKYTQENKQLDIWRYNVITIRDPDPKHGAEIAKLAHSMAVTEHIPLADIPKTIQARAKLEKGILNLSQEFEHNAKDVSEEYKKMLSTMSAGTFSPPIIQKSRKDKTVVYRIFYLKEVLPGGILPFHELAAKLKNKLLDEVSAKESALYIEKLRKKYGISETELSRMFSEDFEPFALN